VKSEQDDPRRKEEEKEAVYMLHTRTNQVKSERKYSKNK